MTPRQIIKILVPSTLFITTFFPIYVSSYGSPTNIYGLVGEMPGAALVPLLFFFSVMAAFATTVRWSSRISALLAIVGVILGLAVNANTDTSVGTPEPYTSITIILYFLVTPVTYLYLLISNIRKRWKLKQKNIEGAKYEPFLVMTPRRFVVLMISSFGFYTLYWLYQNWRTIKVREGSTISPFWRMAFWPFWLYQLFRTVMAEAYKHGHEARYSAKTLAIVYITVVVASTIPGIFLQESIWLLAVSLASLTLNTLILLQVQRAINFTSQGANKSQRRG